MEVIPLSLYIHFPWCVRKCPYCDFNSHGADAELPEAAYIDALIRDLDTELPRIWGRRLVSIFIGGGTPSLLSPEAVARLLGAVRERFNPAPGIEITLEANPGTVDAGRFPAYRAAGVNRLSLGVQSFNDGLLSRIGRIHDGARALAAVEAAQAAGFDGLNLDLMFGLPGQSAGQAQADIQAAVDLRPGHISLYQLTLEPNTPFYHQPPQLPDDESRWTMQARCQEVLADNGYRQYEVSAYARQGQQCEHNLNYWRFGDYLGIGAGAHGKLTLRQPFRILRTARKRHPAAYLAAATDGNFISTEQRLSSEDLPLEFMMNGLRLNEGVPAELFIQRTGLDAGRMAGPLGRARAQGLLERDPRVYRASGLGRRFLDDLLALFVP